MGTYYAIGVMSGTSLDGLDIAYIKFTVDESINFEILNADTYEYTDQVKEVLRQAENFETVRFLRFHNRVGEYIGEELNRFIKANKIEKVDFIASHGHTIFHQPENKFTFQVGNAAYITAVTGITTIADFRSLDIALKGQGAPLVPIGDKILFKDYDYCLNLGGFANISTDINTVRIAYDICPVNIVINEFAKQKNKDYDNEGNMGKAGHVNDLLLSKLNSISFYQQTWPKSLGKEWVSKEFNKILNSLNIDFNDKLRTVYEHISMQIASAINTGSGKSVLITGGGAYNKFLIDLIQQKTNKKLIIPDSEIIEFKEALIFGLLGLLRYLGKDNTLASVTGAVKNSSGGGIYKV